MVRRTSNLLSWSLRRYNGVLRRHQRASTSTVIPCCPSAPSLHFSCAVGHQRRQCSSLDHAACQDRSDVLRSCRGATSVKTSSPLSSSYVHPACRGREGCPTAAILVDTDGSGLVSLPYCASVVHDTVQTRLRALVVERLVAPQLSLAEWCPGEKSAEEDLAEAERLATVALAVQDALHSIRQVAFSTFSPRLQHDSWASLWAAYRRTLKSTSSSTLGTAVCDTKEAHAKTSRKEQKESAMDAAATHVLWGPCEGVWPLFGTGPRAMFFIPPLPLDGATLTEQTAAAGAATTATGKPEVTSDPCAVARPSATTNTHDSGTMNREANLGPTLPSSRPVGASAGSYWECFRVDAFMPAHLQLQAAVRHLLRTRRPSFADLMAGESLMLTSADAMLCQESSPQSLAVIALVVPDHRIDVYEAFLDGMERDRAVALTAASATSTGGDSVQLLLFNSRELVRVCHAV